MNALVVAQISIRQDADGRFCLNDLHKAAVGEGSNHRTTEPSKFLSSQQTIDLIKEFETTQIAGSLFEPKSKAVVTVEGRHGGTFVCKELVYAYAMWVSAKFHLEVIRAYDALVTGRLAKPRRIPRRELELELALERANGRIMQLEHERELDKLRQELANRPTRIVHVQKSDDPWTGIGYEDKS